MNQETNTIKILKNQEYTLDIISEGYEGEGVAKINNYPIFIKGAMIGEKVKIKIVKANKNYAYGMILEIIDKSKNRQEPKCNLYKVCGGCALQHMNYESQLDFKHRRVSDCIERIGKANGQRVEYPIGMVQHPYEYRNKVQLPIGIVNNKVVIGFYASRSHKIIDLDNCIIQSNIADKICCLTKKWIVQNNIMPCTVDGIYHKEGLLRHLMIRTSKNLDEVMVVLVSQSENIPHIDDYINILSKEVRNLKSVIININTKETNVILGTQCITVYGKDTITDYIGKFKFNISPLSFFQVNPIQTEVLYNKALEFANLTGEETVIDAYCGTGTITLFLSQKAKKVYGVEIVEPAIINAKENALINNIDNVEFTVGKSEEVIPQMIKKGIKPDVIVVDPPRKGCDTKLLDCIEEAGIKRIVYVSCDPATLGRDVNILINKGYQLIKVQPVDMFPQTKHVETVVLMSRKDK